MGIVDENNVKLPKHKVYEVKKLLGRGGFGAVCLIRRLKDDRHFAMKCEIIDPERQSKVLMMDCKVLQGTARIKSPHFCKIVDRGRSVDRFNFLIMTLLGANLWDLRMQRDEQKFLMNTSLKAALQCLMAIEDLHRVGYLHRDIKPGNYCIGKKETNDNHIVFMLDFGLCRKFVGDTEDKTRDKAPFRGTTRYAAVAALSEEEQSRKDDLDSWLYMVVEWTTGSLPWKQFTSNNCAPDEPLDWDETTPYRGPIVEDRDKRMQLVVKEDKQCDKVCDLGGGAAPTRKETAATKEASPAAPQATTATTPQTGTNEEVKK